MSKLQNAVAKQYFTDERMMELATLTKDTGKEVKVVDALSGALSTIADNLESSTILLDRAIEADNIDSVKYYEKIINAIVDALPKNITALSKDLNLVKEDDCGADADKVLKALGLTK